MADRWTFYTGFTVVFLFFSTLSLFQRLLVATGGLLGAEIYYAAISYAPIKIPKKAISARYFDPRLLVSIEDEGLKCIYPRVNGCGSNIGGPIIEEFKGHLGSLKRSRSLRDEKSDLDIHLRTMLKLKLCRKHLALTSIDDCIKKCVEKWSIEVQAEAFTKSIRGWEDNGHTAPHEIKQEPPGAYPNPPRSNSMDCPASHERSSSSEQGRFHNLHSQVANNLPPALAASTLQSTIPDLVHPDVPQPIIETAASLRGAPSLSEKQEVPTRAATPANGWCIVPYEPKKPETLHQRIFLDLQIKEVKSGYIYVLHRDDDQEYYKVGFSTRDPQERLEEHNEKCNATWEIVWRTDTPIKHAKRVEKLIHIEAGLRGTRYQENFCRTGAKSCKAQHCEIIKAPLKEVERYVKHWVRWMMSHERYEEVPTAQTGASPTNKQLAWKLTSYHRNLVIHNVSDEFCLDSTGKTWVLTPEQRKSIGRRKSTSVTPTRPSLEDTRETRSEGTKTRSRTQFDTSDDAEAPTGARIVSKFTGSRRKSTLRNSQHAEVQVSVPEDDPANLGDVDLEETRTLHTPRTSTPPCTEADSSPAQEQETPSRPSRAVRVPVIFVNGTQRYNVCCHQCSGSNSHCVACLTPDPEDELRNEDCTLSDDDEDLYVSCESQNSTVA